MTRLKTDWIGDLGGNLEAYDVSLKKKVGLNLFELLARILGCDLETTREKISRIKVAVVRISSGEGQIENFAEAVRDILHWVGCDVFIADSSDINGIHEAVYKGADVLFFADDERYISLNIRNGRMGENDYCTALAYILILESLCESLKGKQVLVLGYGRLGSKAIEILSDKEASISVYDKNPSNVNGAKHKGVVVISNQTKLSQFDIVFDATNEGNWIKKDMVSDQLVMAAPGIPISLDEEARAILEGRYVHDYLELGTISMLGNAL